MFQHLSSLPATIGAFIVVLGIIIFVHEFGHFLSAKIFGMRVFVFSFGFGRRLLGFKWGETDCRLSLIPLGGYVKLEGEPDDLLSPQPPSDGDLIQEARDSRELLGGEKAAGEDFMTRPRWQRIVMYFAGPLMNAVLTVAVLWILYMVGFGEPSTLFEKPVIGGVEPNLPAAQAGLVPGDEIVAIDGKAISNWQEVQYQTLLSPGRDLEYRVRRGGEDLTFKIRPKAEGSAKTGTIGVSPLVQVRSINAGYPAEKAGLHVDDGILDINSRPIRKDQDVTDAIVNSGGQTVSLRIHRAGQILIIPVTPRDDGGVFRIGVGIGGERLVMRRYGPVSAFGAALRRTWEWTAQIFDVLRRLLSGWLSVKTMSGPLGIAQESGAKAREGVIPFFGFLAVISLNVGVLNLFPLVPLDGGHILILLVESVARRDLSLKVKIWIANVGVVLILALVLVIVFYADLSRLGLFKKLIP